MNDLSLQFYVKTSLLKEAIKEALRDEGGQDLVEYALVMALISLAAIAGMTGIATKISTAFTNVGTKLSTYTS